MFKIVFTGCFILIFGSCRTPGYLSKPADFKYHVKGMIIEYEHSKDSLFQGEIIAVSPESITMLPLQNQNGMVVIPREDIHSAEILIASTSD